MAEHTTSPEKRIAQHRLAREVVELVHSPEQASKAELQHTMMFSRSRPKLEDVLKHQPDIILPISQVVGHHFSSLLCAIGLATSKSEGARLIKSGGAYVLLPRASDSAEGGDLSFVSIEKETSYLVKEEHVLVHEDVDTGSPARRLMVFRAGKRKVIFLEIMGDEEFMEKGLDDAAPQRGIPALRYVGTVR
jgi:tyrosyl-tRNA synthetase